jgi:hypothetical protein
LILYAGIGLAVSGVATIFFIYQGLLDSNASPTVTVSQTADEFQLEEVHANPSLVMHTHTRLELQRSGQALQIPAEIGISSDLWHDHSLDHFGPSRGLLAPLHTHDTSGTIHIESVVVRNYTLGEFLSIWGMDRDQIVSVGTASGTPIEDYENHILGRSESLVIEVSD